MHFWVLSKESESESDGNNILPSDGNNISTFHRPVISVFSDEKSACNAIYSYIYEIKLKSSIEAHVDGYKDYMLQTLRSQLFNQDIILLVIDSEPYSGIRIQKKLFNSDSIHEADINERMWYNLRDIKQNNVSYVLLKNIIESYSPTYIDYVDYFIIMIDYENSEVICNFTLPADEFPPIINNKDSYLLIKRECKSYCSVALYFKNALLIKHKLFNDNDVKWEQHLRSTNSGADHRSKLDLIILELETDD